MSGDFTTRGQPAALEAVRSMIAGEPPHAVLLVGPASVGKTSLALDLAAGLLCLDPQPGARPCRSCRGCRQVARGNHPDLHRLAPDGPGGQIKVGDPRRPEPGSVRGLIGELALLPVEGGRRVAVIEAAHRLNEDAQNALLKTLEEPPWGVTIVLCADDEERLLPTVRSRCARVRLGPVGARDIEELLSERGLADPPVAARLARISSGRPGMAVAYSSAADALTLRQEIARSLIDLLDAGAAQRLARGRDLLLRAGELAEALRMPRERREADASATSQLVGPARGRGRSARAGSRSASYAKVAEMAAGAPGVPGRVPSSPEPGADAAGPDVEAGATRGAEDRMAGGDDRSLDPGSTAKASAPERRRAALQLLEIWRDVARDLVIVHRNGAGELRDPSLLEELRAIGARVQPSAALQFLERLGSTGEMIEGNVSPELAVDVLVLAWPRASAAA